MYRKIKIVSIVSILLSAITTVGTQAQNAQSLSQNVGNRIQQYVASGYINNKQASKLQNDLAGIMQREVTGMNQNGGNLNPMQRQQVINETYTLENSLNDEARKNNSNFVAPQQWGQWQNRPGYYDNQHHWHGYTYDQRSHKWNNQSNNNLNNHGWNNNNNAPTQNNNYYRQHHWHNQ
jgi:hypothetical protein